MISGSAAEFAAWMDAKGYTRTGVEYDADQMADAFAAGMEARRGLGAASRPGREASAEAAAPPTLAGVRNRYREIAPVPQPSDPNPDERLARWLAMTGLRRAFLAGRSDDDREAACLAMAAGLLHRRLLATDPARSDLTAGQIATAFADGDGPAEWLSTLADRCGIDPGEVTANASAEHALIVAAQADAERATLETAEAFDLARKGVESLGKLADSHERVLYAVWIDLQRGDSAGALALLGEQLDGFDGPEWEAPETGMEWLNRMRAMRQSPPAEPGSRPEPRRM